MDLWYKWSGNTDADVMHVPPDDGGNRAIAWYALFVVIANVRSGGMLALV